VAHEDYKALLSETMCKGPKAYPGFTDKNGAEIAKECFQLAGKQDAAAAVMQVFLTDTPQSYIQRMSTAWDALPYTGSFTLQDGDWLVFAWSEHGDQGMNTHPIFSADGNVTTGYLIEASGDYPVAWLSHEPSIKSDVYPLAECLQKRYFSENKQGKVDLVFRYKGAQ
jgi:hypothetical protein